MVSRKKADATSVEVEVKKQIAEVKTAFNDFDIADESSRNLHYRAIARLYEYVVFVLNHKSQKDIHFILEAAAITRHANERNAVLPFIKLAFGKVVNTGKTQKVVKGEGKNPSGSEAKAREPVFKNDMDKRFNIYASYVRWLLQNEVPIQDAASRLKSQTLGDIAKADREANPDPHAAQNEAKRTKERDQKYAKRVKNGGWGKLQIELADGKKLPAGLVDIVMDVQPDGSALLMWVNKEPDEVRLKARVNAEESKPKSEKVDAALEELRQIAQSVSAGSAIGADSDFVVREV